jgi:hypothetical protein
MSAQDPTTYLSIIRDGGLACIVMLTLVICLVVVWRGVLHPALQMLQTIFSTVERATQDLRVSTENLRAVTPLLEVKTEKKADR